MVVAVRSVVGEESQLTAAEERLLHSPETVSRQIPKPEVGLVIGKIYPDLDRASIYTLVPTPSPTDAGLPACDFISATADRSNDDSRKKKKVSASAATPPPSLLIDTEWVAEHARQVSRMLLGGMDVVGIYVWASEASLKASTPLLCQTIKAVAHAAKPFLHDQRLLLNLSYSPIRWTCRICSLTSTGRTSDLRPCDFKMGKLLVSLQRFTCTYNFQIRLPIFHESPKVRAFKDVIQFGINCIANELKSARALIDGNLVTEDLRCTSEGSHEVELLLPFMKEPSELCRQEDVTGLVFFSGVVCTTAYLGSKAPLSQVISDIKGDVVASLQSRLDIICEGDIEGDVILPTTNKDLSEGTSIQKIESDPHLHKARHPCSLLFPRRVYIPWFANTLVCDYLRQSETFEDVKDHCKEMLSMEISIEKKIEPEMEAIAAMDNSFWSSASRISVPATDTSTKMVGSCKSNYDHRSNHLSLKVLIMAFVIVLLSVFIAWFLGHHSLRKYMPTS